MNQVNLEICPICKNEYRPTRKKQKTCSTACSKKEWTESFKASGYIPRRRIITAELKNDMLKKYGLHNV